MESNEKIFELKDTQLEFHPEFVISRVKENIILKQHHVDEIQEVCTSFYGHAPFVYLSFRVNSYNVDPTIYPNLKHIDQLAGMGIVSENLRKLSTATFEKNFSPIPFEVFSNPEDAISWAINLVRNKKAGL